MFTGKDVFVVIINKLFSLHNRKRELWQADVVKFTDPLMLEATAGVANLLVIIDVFTKMVCYTRMIYS